MMEIQHLHNTGALMENLEVEEMLGTSNGNVSGGGGGLFGGGSNTNYSGAGGGGSGYIGNSQLTNKKMVMYTTDNSYKNDSNSIKTEITQNVSSTPIANYAKSGNGYARITNMN